MRKMMRVVIEGAEEEGCSRWILFACFFSAFYYGGTVKTRTDALFFFFFFNFGDFYRFIFFRDLGVFWEK